MEWYLTYKGERKRFAEWGIGHVVRKLKNQATDLVTLQVEGRGLGDPVLFEPNEELTIDQDGEHWFRGRVTQTPVFGNVSGEAQQYTLSGSWWYLEQIIYQQNWMEPTNPDDEESTLKEVAKSHLILGQDVNGLALTIGEQIHDVIDYVNRAMGTSVIQLAENFELAVNIPFDECKDLSCAEVIKRLLRWVPDVVTFFDYTQNVPVLHILRRAQLLPVTFNVSQLSSYRLIPRQDLLVPSVVLKFEKTHRNSGNSWKTVEVQKYPETATGQELQALVMTIELEGTQSSYVQQTMETSLIQMNSATWWKNHLPGLKDVQNLTITEPSRGGSLPNEVLSGTVADWMRCRAESDIVRAKISYETEEEVVSQRAVAVKINTTDARSKTYRDLVSFTSEETVPQDLAQRVYEGVSVLQYEGQLVTEQPEVTGSFLGKVINLIGGRSEWETMQAVIQSVEEILDTGKTTLTLGPAKHLGPDDLSELTKSNRWRFSTRNASSRHTAVASGSAYVEQGKFSQVENSSYGPGRYSKLTFYDPNNEGRKISIDTSALEKAYTVQFREEDVSDSGVLKKRYSLASEPFSSDVGVNYDDL